MSINNSVKNTITHRVPPKSFFENIFPGKRLRLKNDVYRNIKDRVWIFNRIEGNEIHLLHESKAYGLIVKIEDIDWDNSSDLRTITKEEVKKNYAQERES